MSCFSRLFGGSKAPEANAEAVPRIRPPMNSTSKPRKGGSDRGQAWASNGSHGDAGFALPGATQNAQLSPTGVPGEANVIQVGRKSQEGDNAQDLELEDIANDFMVNEDIVAATPKHAPSVPDRPPTESSGRSTPSIGSRPASTGGARERDAGPRPHSETPKSMKAANGSVVDWLDPEKSDLPDNTAPVVQKIRWKKGELLGVGAFGKVFLGLNLDSGELMAVKVIPSIGGPDGDEYTRELMREISLMKVLFNEHIVRYIGTERDEANLYIFLEYVPGGSIASVVHKFGKFTEGLVRAYTRQILVGLAYLHEHQIMHRDIKGANILISNDGIVKLADFGASKRITEMLTQNDCMSLKGTPYWMAPEVIMQSGHGRSADIWSVGCTVIEMLTGKPPFSEFPTQVSVLFHIANTQEPPALPANISEECKEFLLSCFQRNPRDRPTAATLLQHPFVMRGLDSPLLKVAPRDGALQPTGGGGRASPDPTRKTPPQAPGNSMQVPTPIELPQSAAASPSKGTAQQPRHLGEIGRIVKEHKGDKIADEQLVRDFLYQQVQEKDAILEGDFRHSLKLLTNKSKKGVGRRGVASPYNRGPSPSPGAQSPLQAAGSPAAKRRPTPDYGALGGQPPPRDDFGGVALGEKPIQSSYAQAQAMAHREVDNSSSEAKIKAEREEKDRMWKEELERERRYQAEERARAGKLDIYDT